MEAANGTLSYSLILLYFLPFIANPKPLSILHPLRFLSSSSFLNPCEVPETAVVKVCPSSSPCSLTAQQPSILIFLCEQHLTVACLFLHSSTCPCLVLLLPLQPLSVVLFSVHTHPLRILSRIAASNTIFMLMTPKFLCPTQLLLWTSVPTPSCLSDISRMSQASTWPKLNSHLSQPAPSPSPFRQVGPHSSNCSEA